MLLLLQTTCPVCGKGTVGSHYTQDGLLCCAACAAKEGVAVAAGGPLPLVWELNLVGWQLLREQVLGGEVGRPAAAAAAAVAGGGAGGATAADEAPDPLGLHDQAMRSKQEQHGSTSAGSSGASSSRGPAFGDSMPTLGMRGLLALLTLQSPAAARAARGMQEDMKRLLPQRLQLDHPGDPGVKQLAAAVACRVYVVVLGVHHYWVKLDGAPLVLLDAEGILQLASRLETAAGAERQQILRQLQRHMAGWKQHKGDTRAHSAGRLRMQVLTVGIFWADQGRVQLQTVLHSEVPLSQPTGALLPTLCGSTRASYMALWESSRTAGTVDGVAVTASIRKAVMKVVPAAFTIHFMGGTTLLWPVPPQVRAGKGYVRSQNASQQLWSLAGATATRDEHPSSYLQQQDNLHLSACQCLHQQTAFQHSPSKTSPLVRARNISQFHCTFLPSFLTWPSGTSQSTVAAPLQPYGHFPVNHPDASGGLPSKSPLFRALPLVLQSVHSFLLIFNMVPVACVSWHVLQDTDNYCLLCKTEKRPDATVLHRMYASGFPAALNVLYFPALTNGQPAAFQSFSRPWSRTLQLGIAPSTHAWAPAYLHGDPAAADVLKTRAFAAAQGFIEGDLVSVAGGASPLAWPILCT
jgi:hypothetical protein